MTSSGVDYTGTVAVGQNGEPCEYWNNTALPPYYQSVIANINRVLYDQNNSYTNECRNIYNNSGGPWCFNNKGGSMLCDIKRCGKV